jgi:hypothetical protein
MTHRWRRTSLTRADGQLVPDDWSLVDVCDQAIARIYRVTGSPRPGEWFWAVLVNAEGRPWNGGTGYELTGAAAKEQCEARAPQSA